MAKRIGLTGGIGSGKSTVGKLFRELGAPVFDADQVARELTQPDTDCGQKIIRLFGDDIVTHDNQIDRKLLGDRVFSDKTLLKQLEAILHPAIRAQLYHLADSNNAPYAILEIQLLIENELYKDMHKSIIVCSDENIRIARLMQTRGLSEEKIRNIMRNQVSDAMRKTHADFIIENNSDITTLRQQVEKLHLLITEQLA